MVQRTIDHGHCAVGLSSVPLFVSIVVCLNAGCGDGVGRPIRATAPSATSGGTSDGSTSEQASGGQATTGGIGGTHSTMSAGGAINAPASGGDSSTAPPPGPPPPSACENSPPWPPDLAAAELEMFGDLNVVRAVGFTCPSDGPSGVAPELAWSAELRCTARALSYERLFGKSSGVGGKAPAEVIVVSPPPFSIDIAELLRSILSNPTDCAKLLDSSLVSIGIGVAGDMRQAQWTFDLSGTVPVGPNGTGP